LYLGVAPVESRWERLLSWVTTKVFFFFLPECFHLNSETIPGHCLLLHYRIFPGSLFINHALIHRFCSESLLSTFNWQWATT